MQTSRQIRRDAMRLWRLCLMNGRPDARRLYDVIDGLVERRHAGALPVLAQLRRFVRLDTIRWAARIESATPLEESERQQIIDALANRYGELRATFKVDPSLIGGLRITAGTDVYDGSVRARLDAVERSF